jgi:hypothetical protein
MPPPVQGQGQTSDLRTALACQATRDATIAQVVVVYEETRNLTPTAARFGCGRRTLERAMAQFPKLGEAIEAARQRLAAVEG